MLGCLFCWAMATLLLFGSDKYEYFNSLSLEFRIMTAIGFIFVGSVSRAASACDDFAVTFKSIFKNANVSLEKEKTVE